MRIRRDRDRADARRLRRRSGGRRTRRGPAGAPHVTKVEPPSWWPGHSINPVRLLVRGTSLDRGDRRRRPDRA